MRRIVQREQVCKEIGDTREKINENRYKTLKRSEKDNDIKVMTEHVYVTSSHLTAGPTYWCCSAGMGPWNTHQEHRGSSFSFPSSFILSSLSLGPTLTHTTLYLFPYSPLIRLAIRSLVSHYTHSHPLTFPISYFSVRLATQFSLYYLITLSIQLHLQFILLCTP